MRFAVLILLLTQLACSMATASDQPGSKCGKTFSRAADVWKKTAASSLGGKSSCAEINPREVQQLACKKEVTVNAHDLGKLGAYMTGAWAEEGVFQIVAGRSERKAQCRNTTFNNYLKLPEKTQALNQKASAKFEESKAELQKLLQYKEELSEKLKTFALAAADGRTSGETMKARKLVEEKIQDVDESLALTSAGLPMGVEPEVARAYVQMAKDGTFDEGIFRQGMGLAQQKYLTAIKYYFDRTQPVSKDTSLFCLDETYRADALKSGAVKNVLDDLLTNKSKLDEKLNCRFNATYGVGAERAKYVGIGVMAASMVFWTTEMAAIKGFQWAKAAVSASGFATASQSFAMISAVTQIQMACSGSEHAMIANAAGAAPLEAPCNPDEEFKKVLEESDNSICAPAVLWNATYLAPAVPKSIEASKKLINTIAPHVREYMVKLRSAIAPRANASAVTSRVDDVVNPIEMTVPDKNGFIITRRAQPVQSLPGPQGRADDVERLKKQGYTFYNDEVFVKHGGSLSLAGDPFGNKISVLVYRLQHQHGTRVFLNNSDTANASAGNKMILLNREYLRDHPELAHATLLHELKHVKSNELKASGTLDRVIMFQSLDNHIPVAGYNKLMRADEVEARLPQIALLKKQGRRADANRIAITAKEMAQAQIEMLKKAKDQLSKAQVVSQRGELTTHMVEVPFRGKILDLTFTLSKTSKKTHLEQLNDQITTRTKYLEGLIKRLSK